MSATTNGKRAFLNRLNRPLAKKPDQRLHRATALTQLLDVAAVTYQMLMTKKHKAVDHAALARAFCLIDERIRIRRGIPLPGQFQPSLDPVLNAKRGRITDDAGAGFSESPKNSPSRKPNESRVAPKADTILLDSTPDDPLQQIKTPVDSVAPQENHAPEAGTPKTKESTMPDAP